MIYALKGKVYSQSVTSVVIDVANVFYEVKIPSLISFEIGSELFLYTYQVIKEDEHYLVGFLSLEERNLFVELLNVNGIGPKTAQNILTGTTPEIFKQAIISENLVYLKKLPGVGPKGASQMILDLKGKLLTLETSPVNKGNEEVLLGLLALGFKKPEINKVLTKLSSQSLSSNELLKKALGELRKL